MNLKITKKLKTQTQAGFTLLEMLLVIAMIAILAGIVIVAINPGRQLAQARNTQRASDLRAIHSAVNQFYIDNREWPAGLSQTEIDGTMEDICKMGEPEVDCISLDILVPNYISTIPVDPQSVASSDGLINTAHAQATNLTGYRIGINPTSQTPNLVALNSTEYDLEKVEIMAACGDPTDERCWSAQGSGLTWGPESFTTGANSDTNGKLNTQTLIDREELFPAAQFCEDSTHGGYTDWYLPARDQLKAGRDAENDGEFSSVFTGNAYWSSTEASYFADGYAFYLVTSFTNPLSAQKSFGYFVRCLR